MKKRKFCDKPLNFNKHKLTIFENILIDFSSINKNFFSIKKNINSKRTRLLKKSLALLGDKLGYKVYCNGLPTSLRTKDNGRFKNVEWLYDVHWYTEKKSSYYSPETLPLIVECEWQNKRKGDTSNQPFSAIKYDFQKLLVTNATNCCMIFSVSSKKKKNFESTFNELEKYFQEALNNYKQISKSTKFLFIAFDKSRKGFYYFVFNKHSKL